MDTKSTEIDDLVRFITDFLGLFILLIQIIAGIGGLINPPTPK